jgi:hypothetical protein
MIVMPVDHPGATPSRSGRARRETLNEKIPGFWVFAAMILIMGAIGAAPTLLKRSWSEAPRSNSPPPTSSMEQDKTRSTIEQAKAKLKTKADTLIKQGGKEAN